MEPGFDRFANLSVDLLEKNRRHKTASNVLAKEAATAMVRKHQQSHAQAPGGWQHPQLQLQHPPQQPQEAQGLCCSPTDSTSELLREIFR